MPLGKIAVWAIMLVLFLGPVIAVFHGLITGKVFTDDKSLDGSWWKNETVSRKESSFCYWFWIVIWGALSIAPGIGIFVLATL